MKTNASVQSLIRCFVAIPIPLEIKQQIEKVLNLLKTQGADAKWVSSANFHFTMKFLGEITATQVDSVIETMESGLSGVEAFPISLKGTGAFPNLERPRVIWCGVSGGEEPLCSLAARIDDLLEPVGFPKEKRPFSAHLTLGRLRSEKGTKSLIGKIKETQDLELGEFLADRVLVMKSDLKPSGPIYTPLKEFLLEG